MSWADETERTRVGNHGDGPPPGITNALPATTTMHLLADHPGLGHLRDDRADEALRAWTVHSDLEICRPDGRPLQVARVLNGYRDIAVLFG